MTIDTNKNSNNADPALKIGQVEINKKLRRTRARKNDLDDKILFEFSFLIPLRHGMYQKLRIRQLAAVADLETVFGVLQAVPSTATLALNYTLSVTPPCFRHFAIPLFRLTA